MGIVSYIKSFTHRLSQNKKWRQKNAHNFTEIHTWNEKVEKLSKISIGNYTYGPLNIWQYEPNAYELRIGHFCSIAQDVMFLLDGEHDYHAISTYPFKARLNGENEGISKGSIIVEDDVWIGYGATILSGVCIGQGAVVAAKSVVVSDVPPYSVVGGVPAKVIKKRFPDEMIEELMKIDYSQVDEAMVKEHMEDFYMPLTQTEQFAWMPKKS